MLVNQCAAVVAGLGDMPCGHERRHSSRCGEEACQHSPAGDQHREHGKSRRDEREVARPLAGMLVVFKCLMHFASCLWQAVFLPLAGFNGNNSTSRPQNENESRRQRPTAENDSQKREARTNNQEGDRKMNNRGMQGLGDRYHAESITPQGSHRKAETADRSDKTPFSKESEEYLLQRT